MTGIVARAFANHLKGSSRDLESARWQERESQKGCTREIVHWRKKEHVRESAIGRGIGAKEQADGSV